MASQLANAIRFLSADAVQKANSGHPGAPMGMADMAEVLWTQFLNHNPANPKFYNRDRFVLSNGHASMILYSLLHLTGYNVSIDDLKNFRQLHSNTPGHPEYGYTDGVETSHGSDNTICETKNEAPLYIGTRTPDANSNFYKGAVDELRIYNRALTVEEIEALFEE